MPTGAVKDELSGCRPSRDGGAWCGGCWEGSGAPVAAQDVRELRHHAADASSDAPSPRAAGRVEVAVVLRLLGSTGEWYQ